MATLLVLSLFHAEASAAPAAPAYAKRPAPPRHIRVGTVVYSIIVAHKVPPAGDASSLAGKACDDNAVKNGWCTAADCIYLEEGRTLQQERTTLLHEIQHIILGTENSKEQTTSHDFIYKLSPKLLQVLQDNPELYSYLTSPAK